MTVHRDRRAPSSVVRVARRSARAARVMRASMCSSRVTRERISSRTICGSVLPSKRWSSGPVRAEHFDQRAMDRALPGAVGREDGAVDVEEDELHVARRAASAGHDRRPRRRPATASASRRAHHATSTRDHGCRLEYIAVRVGPMHAHAAIPEADRRRRARQAAVDDRGPAAHRRASTSCVCDERRPWRRATQRHRAADHRQRRELQAGDALGVRLEQHRVDRPAERAASTSRSPTSDDASRSRRRASPNTTSAMPADRERDADDAASRRRARRRAAGR